MSPDGLVIAGLIVAVVFGIATLLVALAPGASETYRKFLIPACAALAAFALGVVVTASFLSGPSDLAVERDQDRPEPPPTAPGVSSSSAAPEEPRLAGTVTALAPMEGFDFDFGVRDSPPETPGLDISGRRMEYVLDSVAVTGGGRLARLVSGPGIYKKPDCENIPEDEWLTNVPGVPIGGSICVRTSDDNIAILAITKPWTGPNEEEWTISFDYRTWYN